MGLDTIINAYMYTLLRLKKKNEEAGLLEPIVEKEEEEMGEEVEDVSFEEGSEEPEQFEFIG